VQVDEGVSHSQGLVKRGAGFWMSRTSVTCIGGGWSPPDRLILRPREVPFRLAVDRLGVEFLRLTVAARIHFVDCHFSGFEVSGKRERFNDGWRNRSLLSSL